MAWKPFFLPILVGFGTYFGATILVLALDTALHGRFWHMFWHYGYYLERKKGGFRTKKLVLW